MCGMRNKSHTVYKPDKKNDDNPCPPMADLGTLGGSRLVIVYIVLIVCVSLFFKQFCLFIVNVFSPKQIVSQFCNSVIFHLLTSVHFPVIRPLVAMGIFVF